MLPSQQLKCFQNRTQCVRVRVVCAETSLHPSARSSASHIGGSCRRHASPSSIRAGTPPQTRAAPCICVSQGPAPAPGICTYKPTKKRTLRANLYELPSCRAHPGHACATETRSADCAHSATSCAVQGPKCARKVQAVDSCMDVSKGPVNAGGRAERQEKQIWIAQTDNRGTTSQSVVVLHGALRLLGLESRQRRLISTPI